MSRLTVSVAMCTHNGERFVAEQLSTVLTQSRPPDQLVVSDDASTDSTLAVVASTIDEWRRLNPDAKLDVVTIRNSVALGVTANFAGAIAATTGDLIALSDQDDVWMPQRLARMVDEFDRRPELLLLHSDADLISESGRPLGHSLLDSLGVGRRLRRSVHGGDALSILLKRNIVTGATTVFRRSVAVAAAPFPSGWVHDEWLAMVAALAGTVDLLEESLIGYRQHGANQIGVEKLSFVGKVRRVFEAGAERNQRLLVRAEQLADRAATLQASPRSSRAIDSKLRHERVRHSLRSPRLLRVPVIAREYATGRYTTFGRGFADAVRDLLQPL